MQLAGQRQDGGPLPAVINLDGNTMHIGGLRDTATHGTTVLMVEEPANVNGEVQVHRIIMPSSHLQQPQPQQQPQQQHEHQQQQQNQHSNHHFQQLPMHNSQQQTNLLSHHSSLELQQLQSQQHKQEEQQEQKLELQHSFHPEPHVLEQHLQHQHQLKSPEACITTSETQSRAVSSDVLDNQPRMIEVTLSNGQQHRLTLTSTSDVQLGDSGQETVQYQVECLPGETLTEADVQAIQVLAQASILQQH